MELVIKGKNKNLKLLDFPIKRKYFEKYNVYEIEDDYECEELMYEIMAHFNVVAFCR